MLFFDKKEDVMDIQLTRFGKYLLSKGQFKPVFYEFYDDDILYDSNCGGFAEHQNSSEDRILKETPRLRALSISTPLEAPFVVSVAQGKPPGFDTFENPDPEAAARSRAAITARAEQSVDLCDNDIQDRILLYPLGQYEPGSTKAPKFEIRTLDQMFTGSISFLKLTSSGIVKNIPQITINPKHILSEDRSLTRSPRMQDQQTPIDLMSKNVIFADNSKIQIDCKDILLDMEEMNTFYGSDNFEVEIYEVHEIDGRDDALRRIEDMDEINRMFYIRTDEHVTEVSVATGPSRANYRRGES